MKKFICIFSAASVFLLVSCESKQKQGVSDSVQKNLDATHAVTKAFETGDTSKIDEYVAVDFVDHSDKGDVGRDSLKSMIITMHAAQGAMNSKIIKELADEEYVFSMMNYTGTSDGSMGMPAGPYNMNSIEVVKFKEGKAIEHWAYMEPREMMKMMEGMKPAMTDTAKESKMNGPK